jgi:hypothetical protein
MIFQIKNDTKVIDFKESFREIKAKRIKHFIFEIMVSLHNIVYHLGKVLRALTQSAGSSVDQKLRTILPQIFQYLGTFELQ